jgi:hypothetical protein
VQALDIELEPPVTLALFDSLDQVVETANDGLITNEVMAHSFKLIATQVSTACCALHLSWACRMIWISF